MNKSPKEFFEEGTEAARLYARAEIEQFKLKSARRITRYSAGAIKIFVLIAIGAVAALFFTLALALAWGKAINSYAHAFLYMGLIVLGILILVALLSKVLITKPVLRRVIRELFEEGNE
jgi:hypothetical protein